MKKKSCKHCGGKGHIITILNLVEMFEKDAEPLIERSICVCKEEELDNIAHNAN